MAHEPAPGQRGRSRRVEAALTPFTFVGNGRAAPRVHTAALDRPPFAPPILEAGKLLIAQTANILLFLGPRHGLVPRAETGRLWTHQLQLTIADFVAEVHDTHHPIATNLYYAQQKGPL